MNDVVAHPNRPTAVSSTQKPATARKHGKWNKKKTWITAIIIVIILAIGYGIWYFAGYSQVDSSKYQAVFLSNGQVYFGKLHDYYTGHPYLTDVYYIEGSSSSTSSSASSSNNQQLVKLGSEIHAPEDEMILNKSSILFVENLTPNGKVVQLIEKGNG